jgi:hypothetical protein
MAHASSVLCGVLVMIAVQSAPSQVERTLQMFRVRGIERLARNVTVSGGRIHFRVEIGQPRLDSKGH